MALESFVFFEHRFPSLLSLPPWFLLVSWCEKREEAEATHMSPASRIGRESVEEILTARRSCNVRARRRGNRRRIPRLFGPGIFTVEESPGGNSSSSLPPRTPRTGLGLRVGNYRER